MQVESYSAVGVRVTNIIDTPYMKLFADFMVFDQPHYFLKTGLNPLKLR